MQQLWQVQCKLVTNLILLNVSKKQEKKMIEIIFVFSIFLQFPVIIEAALEVSGNRFYIIFQL